MFYICQLEKCCVSPQDNLKPHSARITQDKKKKKKDLIWLILSHLLYLPDIGPSDFHRFSSLQKLLNEKKKSQENLEETFVENFLSLKAAEFYLREINSLPDIWQVPIQNKEGY